MRNGWLHQAFRTAKRISLARVDLKKHWPELLAVAAMVGLILCEFAFPLADREVNTRLAPQVVALRSLALPANETMARYTQEREDFYKRTVNHTRTNYELGLDVYKLASLQMQYLSYFPAAMPLLEDEVDTLGLLSRRSMTKLVESRQGHKLVAGLKTLVSLRPNLARCITDVTDIHNAIERSLNDTGNKELFIEFQVATMDGAMDLIRDRHSRWLACQGYLSDFDRNLSMVVAANPQIDDELEKQADRDKLFKTCLRWLCNLLLFIAVLYRSRLASMISEVFGK